MKWDSLVWIKTIDLKKAINKYIKDLRAKHEMKANELDEKIRTEYKSYLEEKSKLKFQINDNMDIVACFYQAEEQGGAAGQNAKQGDLDGSLFNLKQNKKKGTWEDKIKGYVKERKGNIIYIQKGGVDFDQNAGANPKIKEALKEIGCQLDPVDDPVDS